MELEIGKWYKVKTSTNFKFCFNGDATLLQYGFNMIGDFATNLELTNDIRRYEPMTDQEVKDVLEKEATRRGFVKGVKFIPLIDTEKVHTFLSISITDSKSITVSIPQIQWSDYSNPRIYDNGQWATIVKENKDMEEKDFIIPAEIVQELKEQGVELIFKKGWIWNNSKELAKEALVVAKNTEYLFPYLTSNIGFTNFSETNPNEEQLEIGKLAYFWDSLDSAVITCGKLHEIKNDRYYVKDTGSWRHCSHKNPLEK